MFPTPHPTHGRVEGMDAEAGSYDTEGTLQDNGGNHSMSCTSLFYVCQTTIATHEPTLKDEVIYYRLMTDMIVRLAQTARLTPVILRIRMLWVLVCSCILVVHGDDDQKLKR